MINTSNDLDVVNRIKNDYYEFDKEKFKEYVNFQIKKIYKLFCSSLIDEIKEEYPNLDIDKILQQKSKYRISENMDIINVQYIQLLNYIDEENIIEVYASVYFYDNTKNNKYNIEDKDGYWNDIWIIRYNISYLDENIFTCKRCGASLRRDEENKILICDYCRDSIPLNFNLKMTPIEINTENK